MKIVKQTYITRFNPEGDLLFEFGLDSHPIVSKSDLGIFAILVIAVVIISLSVGIEVLPFLLCGLIIAMSVLLILTHLSYINIAKKTVFRIYTQGIQIKLERQIAFIPFNYMLWVGPYSQLNKSTREKFNVQKEKTFSMITRDTFDTMWCCIFRDENSYALEFCTSKDFIKQLSEELEERNIPCPYTDRL